MLFTQLGSGQGRPLELSEDYATSMLLVQARAVKQTVAHWDRVSMLWLKAPPFARAYPPTKT